VAILTPSLGERGGSYAQARRELREAEDEYARARRLYAVEAVPQRRVHEAEIRLQAAREELAGLAGAGGNGRLAVRTPISGVVSERRITPGSRVEAGEPLFAVVDPTVVWLKVNVSAAQVPQAGATSGASFRVPGSGRSYTARRVISVGSVIDSQSRTVPVIYEVANPGGEIKVGSTATVAVRTGRPATGVLVPTSAILEEDGRPLVYVQPEGERFERREVVVGGEENGMTLLTSGVQAGERVVTGAAYQVRLASLSTAVPAHGHVH
jgi:RND family efflux transporter MFP subunit